jgi:tRNA(fMet)-specific endonuclease VapC
MFSEILRGRDEDICRKAEAYLDVFGRVTISTITVTELVDGFARIEREDRINKLLTELTEKRHECLELDYLSAIMAGRIFGDLYRIGQPIGNADPFIAAIAIVEGIPLVTGNTKHFERIQAAGFPLQLETWR